MPMHPDSIRRRRAWGRLAAQGLVALLPAMVIGPTPAQTQTPTWPDKPVRFLVPYPPGGGTDVIARIVQQKFQAALGQPIVIENRGGAGGSVGTEVVARAAPDGYTVLFTLSSHTINPAIFPRLGYDTVKDFEPVGLVASLPQILVTQPGFAANSVAELTALARAKPGTLSFASVGNGSPGHLAGELQALRTGVKLTHIPYRGGGPAVTDVMGGQVPTLWVSIPAAAPFVKAGKLKALAVSTTQRSAAFPEVPTMQEAGVPDFDVDSWYAIFVPARTPKAIIERLNKALNSVLADADIRDKLLAQGAEGVGGTPEALGAVVATELPRWAKLAKDANIKAE